MSQLSRHGIQGLVEEEEDVGTWGSPIAIQVGDGEGDREEPAEHWWLPQPGKPGEQLLAGCGGLSLVHHGDDGDAQVLRRLK